MKHVLLLTLLAFGAAMRLPAQVVILKTADMPAVNTNIATVSVLYDSLGAVNIGNTGGPQTWNFSNLPVDSFPYTLYYVDTAQAPNSSLFPGTNLASTDELSDTAQYTYYLSSPTEFSQLGYADPLNDIKFSQPFKLFSLPFTYTNSFNQSANISGQSEGLTVSGSIKTTVKADAFGTVTTPLGTFPTLRVYRTTELSLTVLFFNFIQRDTSWEWWTNKFQAPVFSYHRSFFSALGDESYDQYADMLFGQTVADKEPVAATKIDLNIAPNPAGDRAIVRFNLPGAGKTEIMVYNAEGKRVRAEELGYQSPGEQAVELDLSAVSPGAYFVMLQQRGKMLGFKQLIKN